VFAAVRVKIFDIRLAGNDYFPAVLRFAEFIPPHGLLFQKISFVLMSSSAAFYGSENIYNYIFWIVGSSPTMTKKHERFKQKLESFIAGL
jgi:hypothetical protein